MPDVNRRTPMFVTYNLHPSRQHLIHPSKIHAVGNIINYRAHPEVNFTNMIISQCFRMLQGRMGCYYASSITTTCTGHDLSLLSGFVAASYITGEQSLDIQTDLPPPPSSSSLQHAGTMVPSALPESKPMQSQLDHFNLSQQALKTSDKSFSVGNIATTIFIFFQTIMYWVRQKTLYNIEQLFLLVGHFCHVCFCPCRNQRAFQRSNPHGSVPAPLFTFQPQHEEENYNSLLDFKLMKTNIMGQ